MFYFQTNALSANSIAQVVFNVAGRCTFNPETLQLAAGVKFGINTEGWMSGRESNMKPLVSHI